MFLMMISFLLVGLAAGDESWYKLSYQGTREACLNEVVDTSHCPDAFPVFPEAAVANPTCSLAIVGAGTGGLYMGMRLVDEGIVAAADVCIFDATERVGGRAYSLRYSGLNLVVDAGAYRTWPEFTPVTHALITEYLGLNASCYDPGESPCEKFVITDPATGHNLGFTAYIESMADRLISAGARWYPWYYLNKITPANGTLALEFANDATATVRSPTSGVAGGGLVLNVPQRPLLEIFRASAGTLNLGLPVFEAAHAVQTAIATKVYLYYETAWWLELGLTSGSFQLEGDASNMVLNGRYHDGDTICVAGECSGFLLAAYVNDYAGQLSQYFRRFQRERPEPVTIISDSTIEGQMFLEHAHDRITEYHIYENVSPSYAVFTAQQLLTTSGPPAFAVVATWNIATLGSGGGWHGWTDETLVDAMPGILSEDYGIHVVNEAYSKVQSWAEGSLEVADATLASAYGIPRYWDVPVADVPLHLAQTAAVECAGEDEDPDGTTAGTATTDDAGAGATVDDELLCFLGDATVELATDGTTTIKLRDVVAGLEIATGFGTGVVRRVLEHRVGAEVEVVVVDTVAGEVVGTPTHPVFVGGEWREIAETLRNGHFGGGDGVRVETRYVDAFYNLEVEGAGNAYLLNGALIASGLGDNVDLNLQFPRQKIWKDRAAKAAA
ncbi:hypothetical protein CTAYLR_004044 [Chrysophaeum taylorii]|uniref:Vint domain-containing protein n=1 Tax=Chrysophaeum taylorii TaxID=2483200 RepID=A0AAD7UMP4_9STRA|nr:hypothetical protein CTAYLR_004044 [Chrysophaeum taylorii]